MHFFSQSKKWPNKGQWKHFFKLLGKKEKIFLCILSVLFLSSLIFLISSFYIKNTKDIPAYGGIFKEGLIGQPRFINPIYANSDPDRDLVQLVFSGLMKYDENFNIVPSLAQNYEIEENGTVYKFYLKENLLWQDKTPITADDVIFTIKTIQNSDYKSPLRPDWIGVEAEKISENVIKLKLKKPYSAFLENCTLKIIPQHIWQNISAENFSLQSYNLEPVGSGPYKLKKTNQDKGGKIKSITLEKNPYYFGAAPYISEIQFFFFNSEKELFEAAQRNQIQGLTLNTYKNPDNRWQSYYLSMPRFFAVFFNPIKSKPLEDKNVRIALNYAINKKEILKKVFGINDDSDLERIIVNSPILSDLYGTEKPEQIFNFDIEKAKDLLDSAGFKDFDSDGIREKKIEKKPAFQFKKQLSLNSSGEEVKELQKCLLNKFPELFQDGESTGKFGEKTKDAVIKFQEKYADEILKPSNLTKGNGIVKEGTRQKLNEVCFDPPNEVLKLKFQLSTVDQPKMIEMANQVKEALKPLGVEIIINNLAISQLEQDFIKPRNYEMLLFGEVSGAIPDLLPFWYSSQITDPGLNLAMYENKNADTILEELRKINDQKARAQKLADLEKILISDAPAIFLYSPDYVYLVSKNIQNISVKKIINPSKRFIGIESWFIKTKRIFK